jgi:predicted phage-related endonuclease
MKQELRVLSEDVRPKASGAELVCFVGEKEWLEARRNGIGASDIASILGHGFKSSTEVFLDKTRQDDGEPEDSESLDTGKLLEDDVLELYLRRRRRSGADPVIWTRPFSFFRSKSNPIFRASLDGIVTNETIALNAKTAIGGFDEWGEPGTDEIPLRNIYGALWEMFVLGPEYVEHHTPTLLGGKFDIWTVRRDDELIEDMVKRAEAFWEHVKNGTPPEPSIGSSGEKKALAKLYGNVDKTSVVRAEGEIAEIIPLLVQKIEERKAAKKEEDIMKARVLAAVGNSYTISTDDIALICPVTRKKTVDSQRLKAERPAIWEEFASESVSRQVRVKKS